MAGPCPRSIRPAVAKAEALPVFRGADKVGTVLASSSPQRLKSEPTSIQSSQSQAVSDATFPHPSHILIGMLCANRSRLASAGQVAKGLACNPTAQALCVAREQQSMTNDYQAVVGPDPVWGKDDRAPPALGSCGRHQLRRTSGNYTECSASAALAEPKLGVGDLACIGTRERPSYKQ